MHGVLIVGFVDLAAHVVERSFGILGVFGFVRAVTCESSLLLSPF